jgi:hypothetical protein
VTKARLLLSIAAHSVQEHFALVEGLDGEDGFLGFEVDFSRAGASLVEVGTASFAEPRTADWTVREPGRWGRKHAVPGRDFSVAPAPGVRA